MCWIWKLWVQSTMIYLSPIYAMLHLFGHKTLIQLRGFTCYRIKYLRIMFFESRNSHTGPLLKVSKICNSFEKTVLENCVFISKSSKGLLPFIFKNWFKFFFESHSQDTRWSNLGYLKIPSYLTKYYGRYSMIVNSIYIWNHLHSCYENVIFHQVRANKLKRY